MCGAVAKLAQWADRVIMDGCVDPTEDYVNQIGKKNFRFRRLENFRILRESVQFLLEYLVFTLLRAVYM